MKILTKTLTVAFLITCISMPAAAQDTQNEDEVIVSGTVRTDRAMSAYLAGDYEVAEIEFMKNARCALRAVRNLQAGVESAVESTNRTDPSVGTNTAPQPAGSPGGGAVSLPTAPNSVPTASMRGSSFQKKDSLSVADRTCADRGFQLYMMGLSQIKLGKLDEAKKNFKSATVLRKTIYDAHFRLALLEYQDGNIDKAKKQFKKLKRLEAKCRDCESKDDMLQQVQYLKKLLG